VCACVWERQGERERGNTLVKDGNYIDANKVYEESEMRLLEVRCGAMCSLVCCSVLQSVVVRCRVLQCIAVYCTLPDTARHCNALQHTDTQQPLSLAIKRNVARLNILTH